MVVAWLGELAASGVVETTGGSPGVLGRLKLEDLAARVEVAFDPSVSEPEAVEAESTSGTEERQGRAAEAAAEWRGEGRRRGEAGEER